MTAPTGFIWPSDLARAQSQATKPLLPTYDADAEQSTWTPPVHQPQQFDSSPALPLASSAPTTPLLDRLGATASRVGQGALDFGKGILTDMNVFEPGISNKERVFRIANDASFFLPEIKVAETAGLGIRAAIKAAEVGAVSGGLAAIRGTPIVPNALTGAAIGGGISALLTKGRVRGISARSAELADKFSSADPAVLQAALQDAPWGVVSGMLNDASGAEGRFKLSDVANAQRHAELGAKLDDLGYLKQEVELHSPQPSEPLGHPTGEPDFFDEAGKPQFDSPPQQAQELPQSIATKGYLVLGMSRQHLLELGNAFQQSSVISNEGMFDLMQHELHSLDQATLSVNRPAIDHIALPGGQNLTLGLNEPISYAKALGKVPTTPLAQMESLIDRSGGGNMIDENLSIPLQAKLNNWYVRNVRSFHAIEQMQSFLGEKSGELDAQGTTSGKIGSDVAALLQLTASSDNVALSAFRFGLPDYKLRGNSIVAPALQQLLSAVAPGEGAMLEQYGFAKRFGFLNEVRGMALPKLPDGSPLLPATVAAAIHEVETNSPHIARAAAAISDWENKAGEQFLVGSGIIPADLWASITSTSKYHVPIRAVFDTVMASVRQNVAPIDAFEVSPMINRIEKIGGKLEPWTDGIVKNLVAWSKAAHLQDASNAFFDLFEKQDPSVQKLFGEEVAFPSHELSQAQKVELAAMKGTDPELAHAAAKYGEELLSILDPAHFATKGYIGSLRPIKGMMNSAGEFLSHDKIAEMKALEGGDAKFASWAGDQTLVHETEQQQRRWIKLHDGNIFEAFKAMDPGTTSLGVKIMGSVASLLRVGATATLEFLARNTFKDAITAKAESGTKFFDIAKGFASTIKQDEAYQRFLASGGGGTLMDRNMMIDEMKKGLHGTQMSAFGFLGNVVKSPLHMLEALATVSETGTRVGAFEGHYQDLLARGIDPSEAVRRAALYSRNATVDFSVHGSQTQSVRLMAAFWNAGLQGYDNTIRQFQRDPAGALMRTALYVTVPSVLTYLKNRDDPEYFALPQWEREMFWHVKMPSDVPWLGDQWLRFPKPFDVGTVFGSSVEKFLEFLDTDNKGAVDQLAHDYASNTISGLIPLPTAIKPAMENFFNYSLLRSRPIIPASQSDIEPKYQGGPNTSAFAKQLGKFLNYSPYLIDNALAGYTGGLGRLASDVYTAGADARSGQPIPGLDGYFNPANTPGVRGFVSNFPTNSDVTDQFYEQAARAKSALDTQHSLQNSLRLDDMVDWMEHKSVLLAAEPSYASALQSLKSLRAARDQILSDPALTRRERTSQLDSITRSMMAVASSMAPIDQAIKDAKQ